MTELKQTYLNAMYYWYFVPLVSSIPSDTLHELAFVCLLYHHIRSVWSSKCFARCRIPVIKGPAHKRIGPLNIKGPGYVSTHFEKNEYIFSNCVDLVRKLTHFDFFFKVLNFSKCVVT